jgi:hypothetical protein
LTYVITTDMITAVMEIQEATMSARPPTGSTPSPSLAPRNSETRLDPERAAISPIAPLLLRVDGVFEAVLGVLLASSTLTGLYEVLDLPDPATRLVVVGFGLLLLPLLPILWRDSRSTQRRSVLALAGANGVGAIILALWVLIWHGAFHPAGATFVLAVAGILGVLSVLQARAALVTA